jgi:metal-responsive CopG/Arc/MetJ family transcriptional regulator
MVWFPQTLLPLIDSAVCRLDTDRSKFIRNACREKAARAGIIIPTEYLP